MYKLGISERFASQFLDRGQTPITKYPIQSLHEIAMYPAAFVKSQLA
jgi:hypothetical protein